MKIEIELEEVERLRRQIERLENEVKEKDDYIMQNSPQVYKSKALQLADDLLRRYLTKVFEGLGFKDSINSIEDFGFNDTYQWEKRDDITFNISTRISKEFAKAFINIGVNRKDFTENKDLWEV